MIPEVALDLVNTAGDALGHPVVVIGGQEVQVARGHLARDFRHLLRRHGRIQPQRPQRPVEPLDVLLQLEDAMPERSRGIEGAVTHAEAALAEGHQRFALGDEIAVHPDDPLIRKRVHFAASCYRWFHPTPPPAAVKSQLADSVAWRLLW